VSTPNPSPVFANLEQQHKLAKDLLRAARDGDPAALARIRAARGDAGTTTRPLTLADAQLALAREGGFGSGYLWKYAQTVGSAKGGAVTHPGGAREKHCYADI